LEEDTSGGILQQDTPPEDVEPGALWLDTSDNTYQGTVFEELHDEITKRIEVVKQDTPPEGVVEGRVWIDTSEDTFQGTVFEELENSVNENAKNSKDNADKIKDIGEAQDTHLKEKATKEKLGHVQVGDN